MSSGLNPIVFAMRRPVTMMAGVAALVVGCVLAVQRMAIDIFPTLDLPVIYIAQPYGGLNAEQMESQITAYHEGHALYINGLHHVESKTIQGTAIVKLYFHPGTNMGQAMAETVGIVNRALGYMPRGTLPPFILRFDTSNVPVGFLVVEGGPNRTMGELSDMTLQRVRPIFGSLQGVSSPPPMGGNARTIQVNIKPEEMNAKQVTPDDIVVALTAGNVVMPSGNLRTRDQSLIVSANTMANDPRELGDILLKPKVHLRDVCTVLDGVDTPTGYALVNGKRAVYLMVAKTAEASTLSVVNAVKENLPRMQESVPPDVSVRFDFDQSPYVTRAMWGVASEGALGAVLTGLMVLLFLRDWRSVIVVVLNIPLALMGSVLALWATGQTLNLMTLGGLALAVGILVDEATVEVENIHSQMGRTDSVALAVRRGNAETAVPRLLAMLCVLAVFLPMFFMEGAARNLFVPLALAVGFSMITSYVLSSTFVPVVSVWLLRHHGGVLHHAEGSAPDPWFVRLYGRLLERLVRRRWAVVGGYLVAALGVLLVAVPRVGTQIFPNVDTGQFLLKLRAATGTRIERTEEIARKALDVLGEMVGRDNVETTVGFVGATPPGFSNQAIYLWSSGPEEATLRIALKQESGVRVDALKARLREELPRRVGACLRDRLHDDGLDEAEIDQRVAALRLSFGPADVVNEVMSFGSPTPVEVAVYGPNQKDNLAHAAKVRAELEKIPALRDLQYAQAQDYPMLKIELDRERLGESGLSVTDVGKGLLSATSSSRFFVPLYWADLKSGLGYQIQAMVPINEASSVEMVRKIPVGRAADGRQILIQDVAAVRESTAPAEYDRLNLRRVISLTANIEGNDLGRVGREIRAAVARAGEAPRGVRVEVRGQVEPMRQMFNGLAVGLGLAVVAIALLLTAYFQSPRLALVAVAAVPAVLAGVAAALWLTGTTLNLQSFMGAIMAIGVAIANAILLLTFAEKHRRERGAGREAAGGGAVEGAKHRLRPILMTSCAMLAGMVPMALALGEGGEQTAPLGRAVIGGIVAATFATLLVLPSVFAAVQGRAGVASASLDPADPQSGHFNRAALDLG
jgi:multidrug efflux pump subunit AcrB